MELYRTLGVCLTLAEPPEEVKLPILEEVWKDARKETDIKKYILLAEVFIAYPLTYLSVCQEHFQSQRVVVSVLLLLAFSL